MSMYPHYDGALGRVSGAFLPQRYVRRGLISRRPGEQQSRTAKAGRPVGIVAHRRMLRLTAAAERDACVMTVDAALLVDYVDRPLYIVWAIPHRPDLDRFRQTFRFTTVQPLKVQCARRTSHDRIRYCVGIRSIQLDPRTPPRSKHLR